MENNKVFICPVWLSLYNTKVISVRDTTWIGAIKCSLHQVEVGTCTSDTFYTQSKAVKIRKVYQISNFHEWYLAKWHSLALRQVISFTEYILRLLSQENSQLQEDNITGTNKLAICIPGCKWHFDVAAFVQRDPAE